MFWGSATCKSVIRDSVELFRAKSRREDTFSETENWQTLSKMPYSQGGLGRNLTNSSTAVAFTIKLIMIKKKIDTCIRMTEASQELLLSPVTVSAFDGHGPTRDVWG